MTIRRPAIDWFFVAIFVAMIVGSVLPATGVGASICNTATTIVIGLLFFLYGVRLSPAETVAGLKHWRLHLTILSSTYVIFPLIGIGLSFVLRPVLSPLLITGIVYLTLVPSTIQTSTTFTAIAHGNVAGAVVSASASNLLGVFITPALCWLLLMRGSQMQITGAGVLSIVAEILLPFVLGQVCRRWIGSFVTRHPRFNLVDRGSVVLIVYSAFSTATAEGVWHRTTVQQIVIVTSICVGLLVGMLALTWWGGRALGFSRADRIVIQFCGTKKSLASGLPIAGVLFPDQSLALVILALVIYHQIQLIVCGALASRYGRAFDAAQASADPDGRTSAQE
jgi:sodium/bile acid cotransporter 7